MTRFDPTVTDSDMWQYLGPASGCAGCDGGLRRIGRFPFRTWTRRSKINVLILAFQPSGDRDPPTVRMDGTKHQGGFRPYREMVSLHGQA